MIEHHALQEKLRNEYARKTTSRRSINKGGGATDIETLRESKRLREQETRRKELASAKTKLRLAVSKAKKALLARGVQARKNERERKTRLINYISQGELPSFLNLI